MKEQQEAKKRLAKKKAFRRKYSLLWKLTYFFKTLHK
jgi:hypothetical protein